MDSSSVYGSKRSMSKSRLENDGQGLSIMKKVQPKQQPYTGFSSYLNVENLNRSEIKRMNTFETIGEASTSQAQIVSFKIIPPNRNNDTLQKERVPLDPPYNGNEPLNQRHSFRRFSKNQGSMFPPNKSLSMDSSKRFILKDDYGNPIDVERVALSKFILIITRLEGIN